MKGDMYAGEIDALKKLAPNVDITLRAKASANPRESVSSLRTSLQRTGRNQLAKEKMLSGQF